jgi:hypothetical protein
VNETRRVYARATSLSELTLEDGLAFVKQYHSQGIAVPGKNAKAYGLVHDGELLAVAIFCNPRTSGMQRKYTSELLRMAFKAGVRIPGGASKLIRNFLTVSNTHALFTYQATDGEATDVYALAGGVLKGSSKPTKQILVKDGLTHETAANNHRDWFSLELATRRGPDALIGTDFGEVLDDSGKRKSNIRLFIEDCGYHLETVAGDRVYEWQNPDRTFYVYKLTTDENDSYYIGRSSVLKAGVTAKECENDGYLGSGGDKLKVWRAALTPDQIHKDILGIYPTWEKVLQAEKKFIGDSYLTDPNCLNMVTGGHWSGFGAFQPTYLKKLCSIHGETTHRGEKCAKCTGEVGVSYSVCPIHGETAHRANKCMNCLGAQAFELAICEVHGESKHANGVCKSCAAEKSVTTKQCPIHGEVKHIGDKCYSCRAQNVTTDVCSIHGETLFRHGHCGRCVASDAITTKSCPIHGDATFNGGKCTACQVDKTYGLKECAVHGLTKHQGSVCNSCLMNSNYKLQVCPIHGETKFKGDKCHRCSLSSAYFQADCPKHGVGAFTKTGGCRRCKREANKAQADIRNSSEGEV